MKKICIGTEFYIFALELTKIFKKRVPAYEDKLSFRSNEVTEKSLISLKRFLPSVEMTEC